VQVDRGATEDEVAKVRFALRVLSGAGALQDGRSAEATDQIAALIERAPALGMYAEEMDPTSGAHLGNFSQELTPRALQAALALRDARFMLRS
jgi:hypothetical protein